MREKHPTLYETNWLAQRIAAGATLSAIGRELGCQPATVRTAVRRLNIELPTRPHHHIDRAWLQAQLESGRTQRSIANELDCAPSTIRNAARRLNVEIPVTRPGRVHKLRDRAWLQAQLESGRTQRSIANELGCSKTTVSKVVIALFGDHYHLEHPHLHDKTWLESQLNAGRTQRQMAAAANCSPRAIRDALDRFDLRGR